MHAARLYDPTGNCLVPSVGTYGNGCQCYGGSFLQFRKWGTHRVFSTANTGAAGLLTWLAMSPTAHAVFQRVETHYQSENTSQNL